MTDEERESLVLMVSRGQSTYGEIRAAFPNVAEYTWRLCGKGAYPSSDVVICRRGGDRDTELRDEEVFELTYAGKNLLHRIEKERRQELLAIVTTVASIIAAICSLAGLLLG